MSREGTRDGARGTIILLPLQNTHDKKRGITATVQADFRREVLLALFCEWILYIIYMYTYVYINICIITC